MQKSMDTSCGLAVAVAVAAAVADVELAPVADADAAYAVDAAASGIPTTSPKCAEHLAVDLTTSRCVIIMLSGCGRRAYGQGEMAMGSRCDERNL